MDIVKHFAACLHIKWFTVHKYGDVSLNCSKKGRFLWRHKRTEVSFDLILLWHHYMETKTPTDTENDVFLVSSRLFLAN